MADFKQKRKQWGMKSKMEGNKNGRRGVSVFQRQLRKRKVWVDKYENGLLLCNAFFNAFISLI